MMDMNENIQKDYEKILSELIQKQILILGPDITFAKVKKIGGLSVDGSGVVTHIEGDPPSVLQKLINEFVDLSGLILKQTVESIIAHYPHLSHLVPPPEIISNHNSVSRDLFQSDPQTVGVSSPPEMTSPSEPEDVKEVDRKGQG